MPLVRSAAENQLITNGARIALHGRQLATAIRKQADQEPIITRARADVVRAIVDAAPLLTAEQREMLRPILSGTLPADTSESAA